MSPESTSTTEEQIVSGQTVRVPRPESGAEVAVTSSPAGVLELGFDPSGVNTTRVDNNLVFELEGGGKITVTDFFAVGDQSLPTLRMPDGVEVASADFFEGSGLDMTTAAGPAASAPPSSGTSYDDDGGNLLSGVDKYGMLGTDYWGRQTEPDIEARGVQESPGGEFTLGGNSYDLNGVFVSSGIFEDWRPEQHVGDYDSKLFGKIDFNFIPSGTTVVDSIHLSGFDAGTIIIIGAPQFDAAGNLTNGTVVAGPGQVFDFTQGNFTGDGVYVLPPTNSDHDMNINVSVDMHAESSGITGSVNGNFTIIVDAVADQPFVKDAFFDEAHIVGSVETAQGGGEGDYDGKGHYVTEHTMDGTEQVSVTIPFETTVTFSDYEDNSESHYVLIEVPALPAGADWICMDANGNPLATITGPDGKAYFQYPVDNADLAANNGDITVNVNLTVSGDSNTVVDTDMNLQVGAMAEERPDDDELRQDNNVSFDWKEGGADLNLDVVDGGLKVTAGWASEGNNDAKYLGQTQTSDGHVHTGPEAGATNNAADGLTNTGAPIVIEAGMGAHGTPEHITGVTFTYDASQGHLYHNGVDLDPSGSGTVTMSGLNTGRLDGVEYRPNDGSFSDEDVNIQYQVNVQNDAGVSGSYNGSVTVAVDAVADKPIDTGATGPGYSYQGEDGFTAATAGSIVSFTVSATFPDTQGSENHFLLVQVPPNGSHLVLCDAQGNPISYETVPGPDGKDYYKIPVPGGQSPASADVHFKVSDRDGARDGEYDIKTGALAEVDAGIDRIDQEYDRSNNQAWTFNPPTHIVVDYLDTTGKAGNTDMYEDNMDRQGGWGLMVDDHTRTGYGDGELTIALVNGADGNTVLTGNVTITFTWEGDSSINSLHFTMHGQDYYATRGAGNEFTLTVPSGDFSNNNSAPGEFRDALTYVPPTNDDHDLKDIHFESDVKNLATGESSHVSYDVADPLIVDAVADRPAVDRNATGADVEYAHDGVVAPESATWGSDVTFTVTVTFKDVADGSEQHYVLVEAKPGLSGDYPTVTGPDGKVYFYVDANDGIAQALAPQNNGSYTDADGITYTKTIVDGQPQVTVSVNVTVTLPENGNHDYMKGDGSINLGAGGLAVEGTGIVNGKIVTSGTSDTETRLDNNVAMDLDTVEVKINVVTSNPTVTITYNNIYENLTPYAHTEAKGSETRSEGATITVGGLAAGEEADITFTFDFVGPKTAEEHTFDSVPGHTDDVMRLEVVDANGTVIDTYPITWDSVNNQWTCTVPVSGDDSGNKIIFKPGWNNNSTDIQIDYDISVTDPVSGDQKEWHSGDNAGLPSLGVVVDAVAQKPDLEGVEAAYDKTGGTDAFVSGGTVDIGAKITFHDFEDGSEKHFVLVEAQVGWVAPNAAITVYDASGVAHNVQVTWSMQMIDGHMYYKAEVPNAVIQNYGQGQSGGELDVHVNMQSPSNVGGSVTISVGGGSWENAAVVDGELRWDNNTAFTFEDVGMNFSAAGDIGLRPSGPAWENDTPNAHGGPSVAGTTDGTYAGGVTLTLTGSHTGDQITDFTFTNYDSSKGTIYWNGPNGPVVLNPNGTIPGGPTLTDGDSFTFVPGHNYQDNDVNFNYTATVTDPRSGDVKNPDHTATVLIDAVAQKPGEVGVDEQATVDWGQGGQHGGNGQGEAKITVTTTFEDVNDGSEKHYVLVEAKPNMEVVGSTGTFSVYDPTANGGKGGYITYHKVLVDNADINANGTVSVEVTIRVPGDDNVIRNMPNDWTNIKTGALAEEKTLSGGEQTYHNNTAYTEGGEVQLDGFGGPGVGGNYTGIWVDPAYENDRPNSHLGDEMSAGGSNVHFGNGVTSADVTWDASQGHFVDKNGNTYENGTATLDVANDGPFTFVPTGHGDGDVKLDYTTHGPRGDLSGSTTIIIDAVANKPTDLDAEATVDYGQDASGNDYTAMGANDGHGNDGSVTVHVTGAFADEDGSEKHYALVEAQPGFTVPGGEMVYLDGKAYWQVEMAKGSDGKYLTDPTTGKEYADVVVVVQNPSLIGSGGHNLATGILAQEQNNGRPGDYETKIDNNISWTLGGNAHIETSFVDSSVFVSVPSDIMERGEGEAGFAVNISGTLGANDVFHGLTVNGNGGSFSVVDANGVGGWNIDNNGNLVINDWNAIGNITVTFTPDANSDTDLNFGWSANFSDTKSGDERSYGGSPTVVVDAVANAPDIVVKGFESDSGNEAALAKEGANVTTTLHFADTDGSEIHYAVMEQGGTWLCDSVTINGVDYPIITIFDQAGKPHYAVEIPNSALDQNGNVNISWHVTAPDATHDVDANLKVGGISVETTTGAGSDKELSLTNNWDENVQNVPVHIGVFETTGVGFSKDGALVEGGSVVLHLQAPAAGTHEIITETEFTFSQAGAKSGDVIGAVHYDDTDYPVVAGADGKGHVTINFGQGGYNPNADFRFTATDENGNPTHNSGAVTVDTSSTVQDVRTGEEHTFTDHDVFTVQGVADAPTGLSATGPTVPVGNGGQITITVDAHFADVDGSENHFVLVEVKAGWTCSPTPNGTYTADGTTYWRVPVDAKQGDVSKDITLTAPKNYVVGDSPESFKTGGLAQEKAGGSDNTKGFTSGDAVHVTIHNEAQLSVVTNNPAGNVVEGDGISFKMALQNANGSGPITATEAMTVTFLCKVPNGVIDWSAAVDAGAITSSTYESVLGGWSVTVSLPAGSSSVDINIPTISASGFQGDQLVSISVVSVDVNGAALDSYVAVSDAQTPFTYTVQDPASFQVGHDAAFDGSQSAHGLEITGDGDNAITGSDHNDAIHAGDGGSTVNAGAGDDVIYAGSGDDALTGGTGNDIFTWESNHLGGSDTILNFDFNYTWNEQGQLEATSTGADHDKIQLNFTELLGETQSLDQLLSALTQDPSDAPSFKVAAGSGTFEATFLNNAQLEITLTDGNDTLQTITVNSATDFHTDAANMSAEQAAMILQTILSNY